MLYPMATAVHAILQQQKFLYMNKSAHTSTVAAADRLWCVGTIKYVLLVSTMVLNSPDVTSRYS